MLLHEQRGRHEHGHLLAVLHRLERGAHRDLGFAEAHVAADQTVHRHWFLHVRLDLVDGGELVGRLLIRERVLQLLLPRRVRAERKPFVRWRGRVQLDQILGDLMHVLARLGLGGGPVGTAELVELRRFGADVFADLVELVGGDEQFVRRRAAFAGSVFDDQVFAGGLVLAVADGTLAHLDEPADAMLFVHDVIARFEFHQVDGLAAAFRRFRLSCGGCAAGQVAFGEQGDFRGVVHETVDGARADALEIRDAGFVDRTLQSGECALAPRP